MHSPRIMGEAMRNRVWKRTALLCGVATVALATAGFAQAAEAAKFDIAPQALSTALAQFGVDVNSPRQTEREVRRIADCPEPATSVAVKSPSRNC